MNRPLSAENKKWQREDDARTLAAAQEIMANKSRHNGAIREAKVMAKQDEARAKAMKKIASKKIVKKKPKKKLKKKK